jgi:hypothetical protein
MHPDDFRELKIVEVNKLWNSVFGIAKDVTPPFKIKEVVSRLCRRMLFLKTKTPPFFGLLVLEILKHPKCDICSK